MSINVYIRVRHIGGSSIADENTHKTPTKILEAQKRYHDRLGGQERYKRNLKSGVNTYIRKYADYDDIKAIQTLAASRLAELEK